MRQYDDDDYDDEDEDDYDDERPSRRRLGRRGRRDGEESKRLLAGLMGILLGWLGVHKFVLGYNGEGATLLTLSLVGVVAGVVGFVGGTVCCFPVVLMVLLVMPLCAWIIGLVEGITYLTRSDEEFIEIYQIGRKTWF